MATAAPPPDMAALEHSLALLRERDRRAVLRRVGGGASSEEVREMIEAFAARRGGDADGEFSDEEMSDEEGGGDELEGGGESSGDSEKELSDED
jgi:hypothetical protein